MTKYMVEVEEENGKTFARRYFTNKDKALAYAKLLEKRYMYLVVHMIEI